MYRPVGSFGYLGWLGHNPLRHSAPSTQAPGNACITRPALSLTETDEFSTL